MNKTANFFKRPMRCTENEVDSEIETLYLVGSVVRENQRSCPNNIRSVVRHGGERIKVEDEKTYKMGW